MLRRVFLGIVLAFLVLLAMLFAALNQQSFDVDVAFARFAVSSGLALLIAFAAGLLAGAFARSWWMAELLAERGRLRRALRLAEQRLGGTPSVLASTSGTHGVSDTSAAAGTADTSATSGTSANAH